MVKRTKTSRKIKRAVQRMPKAPLTRLQNALSVNEYTAAYEILATSRLINGMRPHADPSFENPLAHVDFDAAERLAVRRTDLVKVYPRWRADLKDTVPLAIAEAVLFAEEPLADIDARHHWRKGTAREHLATALKHFAFLRFNTPAGIGKRWKYESPST